MRCIVEGCESDKIFSKGLCRHHYDRLNKYGDPLWKPIRISPVVRFMSKVVKVESGCWEWEAGINNVTSYAVFYFNGRQIMAHRFSYMVFNDRLIPKMEIDHLCRNRRCVNPCHLEQVTQKENLLRGEGIGAINSKKELCKRGHPLSGDNIRINARGSRVCKACHQERYQTVGKKQQREKRGSKRFYNV